MQQKCCVANCKNYIYPLLFAALRDKLLCVTRLDRNLQRNFVATSVLRSREISRWRARCKLRKKFANAGYWLDAVMLLMINTLLRLAPSAYVACIYYAYVASVNQTIGDVAETVFSLARMQLTR